MATQRQQQAQTQTQTETAKQASSEDQPSQKRLPRLKDYEWTETEEPHAVRRMMILRDHPEVKQLFGADPRSKWYAIVTVLLQIFLAIALSRPGVSWLLYFIVAWVVGGTCNASLTLAIHELSHDLFFQTSLYNKIFALFCNFPIIVPYSSSFKKYHLEHHKKQGVDGKDVDIPTEWEGKTFTTPFMKFLWVLFQPAFYALRPVIINPKGVIPLDVINLVTQVVFLYSLFIAGGWGALGYMTLSTWLGLGMHPCAGHFIAEHYTQIWSEGEENMNLTSISPVKVGSDVLQLDETFSYRGPLNAISYNVGLHVAHHDFPYVSGFRLAELEKMCPEYYDHLPVCESWPGTIYKYIMSEGNPFDRVKRISASGGKIFRKKTQ